MIAKTIADDIRYESLPDGRNCFVMTKSFAKMM
jgi:serine/threonine-protein kinase RsbW